MLLPEPTYKGPENIVYFRGNTLSEELARDKNVVWMVRSVLKYLLYFILI